MTKIILITGGSRGFGAATARMAASQGYDVAIGYARDADSVARVVAAGRPILAHQFSDAEAMLRVNVLDAILCARSRATDEHGARWALRSDHKPQLGRPTAWRCRCRRCLCRKGAIDSFTIGLGREIAGRGIRVNGDSPGMTATDMTSGSMRPARITPDRPWRRSERNRRRDPHFRPQAYCLDLPGGCQQREILPD